MITRTHEQTLNVWLAQALQEHHLDAKQEVMHPGNRRIDIEVTVGPAKIAVEAEHGQSNAKQREAIRDADARPSQNLAQCSIAVCYPGDTTKESLPDSELLWTLRDGSGGPPSWTRGNLEQLASVIRLAPAQLGNPDYSAASLSNSLDAAVRRLSEAQKRGLARGLDLPMRRLNGRPAREPWNEPAKRALLVIATAVMFHSRLDIHLEGLRPSYDNRTTPSVPFKGEWPPLMAQQCANSGNPIGAFDAAWDLILALDYKPIFETGRAALLSCPPDPALSAAVSETAKAALAVVQNIAGLRHDLLGRIFHTVLDTARYDGSFYTTTAAATLLAALAIGEDLCDWNDPEAIARLRITDPACGTGTLLMAAAERIRELAPQAEVDNDLARSLIEQVFSGYDVNLTATHMAATTLGLLSPTTRFRNMKIGRTLLGLDKNGKARLGSLEFLGDGQPMLIPFPNGEPQARQVDTGAEIVRIDPADLVIMNPTFTRDSLRHDQFDADTERKIKSREKELFADRPTYMAGNSGAFLMLADYINRDSAGAIAAVLPLVGATDKSGLNIRRHLGNRYHIETIVTSHDPERRYFSENTEIGEMLLICRRWPSGKEDKPPTQVVNLARNPATPAEAKPVAWAIQNGTADSQGYGTVQEWPAAKIAVGDWGAVQFLQPHLCHSFAVLTSGGLFPFLQLGKIANIGPEGRRIRDAFTKSEMPDADGRVALWQHDTEKTQSMAADADTHIIAKTDKAHLAANYWRQRSRLLLPMRARLNTVRVLSVRLDTPAVGSAWSPCNAAIPGIDTQTLEKALCAYLNSSVGVLAILGNRTNKEISYPRFSIDDLRNLVVPDFTAIGGDAADKLAAAYDSQAKKLLLPLPQMAGCPVRRALDDELCDALALDGETVDAIRRNLTAEPAVTSKRYSGRPA